MAPSPTGLLHLGNAWAFLCAWLLCRWSGGRLVLRIEDIDPERSRPEFVRAICEDLCWLGLDWDEGPSVDGTDDRHFYFQSFRLPLYEEALARLDAAGMLYPCFCTRRELRTLAGAPHIGDEGAPYPGTCRNLTDEQRAALRAAGRKASLRLRCPGTIFMIEDLVHGRKVVTTADCGGDFVVRRSDGVIAYHLAVVVDDGLMGITQVVRGRDLLSSTARQLALLQLLGFPSPIYAHVPLLCDRLGERLAKRHASLSLRALREKGVTSRAVIGYLAGVSELRNTIQPVHPRELADGGRIVFPMWWRERDILLGEDPVGDLKRLSMQG